MLLVTNLLRNRCLPLARVFSTINMEGTEENKPSKNALKKAAKAERAAKAKAEKEAKKQAEKEAKGVDMEDLDPTAYFQNRSAYVQARKDAGDNPYPHKFQTTMRLTEFVEKYNHLAKGERVESEIQNLTGRIISKRNQGKKLVFYDLQQDGAQIQILADENSHQEGNFAEIHASIHRGDIVAIVGIPCRSSPKNKEGDLSIVPVSIQVLAPCLHMLPKQDKLKEQETRYRRRYLDLICNQPNRKIFETRSMILKECRNFFDERGFIEVETPQMNVIPGGATANPFVTHHRELDIDMYMRIAPELYLKMLIVGGFDRVYEIGKQFRNEGIDLTHNPEFTTMEFYWAYADYNDLMSVTEDLLSSMVLKIKGSYKFMYHKDGPDTEPIEIDFTPPFKRIPLVEGIEERLGVTIPKEDWYSEETRQFLIKLCDEKEVNVPEPKTTPRMLDKLAGDFIEPECVSPTYIINHPQIMSPLAKYHRSTPGLTERLECFVNCHEIINAYTELNDPFVQRKCFEDQMKQKSAGDEEGMIYDEEFCIALEHGLPPTAGWGMGIDRLTMLLSDKNNIKEVLLFPAMKPN